VPQTFYGLQMSHLHY